MTSTGDAEAGKRMTRGAAQNRQARAAALPAERESGLPERLPWPAAAAVIAGVSLGLWGMIGLGVAWLVG